MYKRQIHTIGELARSDPQLLKRHLGEKYALLIHRYANGIDTDPVAEREPLNKGYGNSVTLAQDVTDLPSARQVLLSLCETVGARLRADHIPVSYTHLGFPLPCQQNRS